jgi:hypothetical protein
MTQTKLTGKILAHFLHKAQQAQRVDEQQESFTQANMFWYNTRTGKSIKMGGMRGYDHAQSVVDNPRWYGISTSALKKFQFKDKEGLLRYDDTKLCDLIIKNGWAKITIMTVSSASIEAYTVAGVTAALQWIDDRGSYHIKSCVVHTTKNNRTRTFNNRQQLDKFLSPSTHPFPKR